MKKPHKNQSAADMVSEYRISEALASSGFQPPSPGNDTPAMRRGTVED
jgi:hypothetical protein